MNKPQLVIMAAGLGSRFGGLKQITPVDEQGHWIIDFSIYDALRAGFGDIILIIKEENEPLFRETLGARIGNKANLIYVHQKPDMLPEGYSIPEGRTKPWGTAHAVLCALDQVEGPFAVINADDFYGRGAFKAAADFLNAPGDPDEHAMVGYRIENTLTENGSVSRGVCATDKAGYLSAIEERLRIEPRAGGAAWTEDDGATWQPIPAGTPVSMNLWAFRPGIVPAFRAGFDAFLRDTVPANPMKAEYYLPYVPKAGIADGTCRVRVLPTDERWYGMTYREDIAAVREAISDMKRRGVYPERLWG